ncbi:MAG: efflux RND transporter periplasmic adaptor subunit, partial [Gemmatimonadaceae bacterium]
AKRLVDAGVSPRKDLEAANAELASARANAATANRTQQLARLQSPIAGVVTRLNAVLGANADVAQTLVEISDTRSLDLLLVLSPSLAAGVHNGQAVALRDAANSTEKTADGRIADVSAVVDSESRGVVVRVAIDKQQRTVRIGETLFGQVITGTHKAAIVIPDDALVPTGEGFQVFVVDSEHIAHARPVIVGGRDGHRVWISEGLKTGERVVTAGAFGLDDGNTVVEAAPSKGQKSP